METRLTKLLNMECPIMVAGMAPTTGPDLAAAVSNAGGFGTMGCASLSPVGLRKTIHQCRALLKPGRPMGVDLLLPKVGDGAKKTNRSYTGDQLEELVQVMEQELRPGDLFVCAVGLPPKFVVDRLHSRGIKVMNMIGSPKHVKGCLATGVDIICAQGGEGGGHTGSVSSMVLLPQVVDLCRNSGVLVVGAGGLVNGRGIAAALALGADGVWMGSRFIVTPEANAPPELKQCLLKATSDDTVHTRLYTGRTLRALASPYHKQWEEEKITEMRALLDKGRVPFEQDLRKGHFGKGPQAARAVGWWMGGYTPDAWMDRRAPVPPGTDLLSLGVTAGQAVGALTKIQPAEEVLKQLVAELKEALGSLPRARL